MEQAALFEASAPKVLPEIVKVFVANDLKRVLLVKERGKPHDQHDIATGTTHWRKRPGMGLPGGKIEGTTEQMIEGIEYHLRKQGIETPRLASQLRRVCKRFLKMEHVVLTSIKEVLEETGIFVIPTSVRLWRRSDHEVMWFVMARPVKRGILGSLDVQIEYCAWFPEDDLPPNTYTRAKAMVREALERQKGTRI